MISTVLDIVDVVATAEIKQSVALPKVGKLPHCLHDPTKYGGRVAYVKHPKMKGKVSVFPSGKMISVGTKSEKQARSDLGYIVSYLSKASLIKRCEIMPKLQNLVAALTPDTTLDLDSLANHLPNTIYEPEQFPGIIHHPNRFPAIAILIFASGKAVIAGAKTMKQLEEGKEELIRIAHHVTSEKLHKDMIRPPSQTLY